MPVKSIYKAVGVLGAAAVLVLAACGSDDKAESNGNPLDRPAKGELTANGGASRLGGDQTDAIRGVINGSGAKNIILLIGDGMGDSEITLARNYEKGAGGFFAGIDGLPLTGSVHDLRAAQGRQAGLRHRLGCERHRLVHRHQDLQRRAGHQHQG